MLKKILILVFAIAGFGNSATADNASLPDRLDKIIQEASSKHSFAGMSIAVSWKGHSILDKGYGMANIETKQVSDAQTIYGIGSMTKQFAAAAVLQLADKGLIDLDSDIHTYVPEYPSHQPAITLRSLLTHTSGIPDYLPADESGAKDLFKPITQADVVKRFANSPLDFSTGSNFAYSNSNFFLLGLAIERVSGKSFNNYLRDHIFKPNGLEIYECANSEVGAKMAQGYTLDESKKPKASPDFEMSWAYAAGNLCATTGAIVKWNQVLHKGNLLSPWAYSIMTTVVLLADGTPTTYGAGLFINYIDGHRHLEHAGDTLTFHAQGAYFPDDDLSIVILTNTDAPLDRYGLERLIAREILGLKAKEQTAKPIPADLFAKLSGSYNVLGRQIFPNPVILKVTSDKLYFSIAGQDIELIYLGSGKFVIDYGHRDAFLVFPYSDGATPFFSLLINEMLLARGMRTDVQVGAQDLQNNFRLPLHENAIFRF